MLGLRLESGLGLEEDEAGSWSEGGGRERKTTAETESKKLTREVGPTQVLPIGWAQGIRDVQIGVGG